MKTKIYTLPLLLMGISGYSQDRISKKNGTSFDAKIIEVGADRDNGSLRLAAEFEGNNIRINSVDKNGKLYYEGDLWNLSNVVDFHKVSKRKNGDAFLNIVTYKVKRSSEKLDKLVIRVINYGVAEELSEAFKDLNIMLKKDL